MATSQTKSKANWSSFAKGRCAIENNPATQCEERERTRSCVSFTAPVLVERKPRGASYPLAKPGLIWDIPLRAADSRSGQVMPMSSSLPDEPIILLDPHPRRLDRIFDEPTKRRLERLGRVIWHDGSPASAEHIDRYLPLTVALIGQSPLDKSSLDRGPNLRAVL